MKHFISLAHGSVRYLRGREVVGEIVTQPGKEEEALARLVREHALKGKCAALLVEEGISAVSLTLPPAGKRELSAMAENDLRSRGMLEDGDLFACDICKSGRKLPAYVTAFTMKSKNMENLTKLMAGAGISCRKVIPKGAALAAAAGRIREKEALLLVSVTGEQVEIYGLWRGHIISCHTSGLKPAEFIALGTERWLWEEIGERGRMSLLEMHQMKGIVPPSEMLLYIEGISCRKEESAERLSDITGLPCRIWEARKGKKPVSFRPKKNVGKADGRRETLRFFPLFLLFLFLAAGCLGVHSVSDRAQAEAYRYQEEAAEKEKAQREAFSEAARLLGEPTAASLDASERRTLKGLTDSPAYHAKVTAVRYSREENLLEAAVLLPSAGSVPKLEEGLRDTGIFSETGHRSWEKTETGEYMAVLWGRGKEKRRAAETENFFYRDPETSFVDRMLQELARSSGVEILVMEIGEPAEWRNPEETGVSIMERSIHMEFTCPDVWDIGKFAEQAEKTGRSLILSEVSAEIGEETGQMAGSMEAVYYYVQTK